MPYKSSSSLPSHAHHLSSPSPLTWLNQPDACLLSAACLSARAAAMAASFAAAAASFSARAASAAANASSRFFLRTSASWRARSSGWGVGAGTRSRNHTVSNNQMTPLAGSISSPASHNPPHVPLHRHGLGYAEQSAPPEVKEIRIITGRVE